MKIAMLYANWEEHGEKWSTPLGIKNALIKLGHEVQVFNLYHENGKLNFRTKIRNYSNEGLNQLAAAVRNKCFEPDAIFVMDYGPWQTNWLSKAAFPNSVLIKESGDEPQSHRMHMQTAQNFHAVLSPDYECVTRYNAMGIKAFWWTHHADTDLFVASPQIPITSDCVTTCGPRGNGLTDKISKALGARFDNSRYFYGQDHANKLNGGKIVFQCSQFGEITRRIFEGAACGKMVLTDRLRKETQIESILRDGKDIVYYDSAEDAIDKIIYFSEHDKEREKIAKSGFNKVTKKHSHIKRAQELIEIINDIKNSG